MTNLPYIEPINELSLNVGVVMSILARLAQTKTGKLVLNLERIQIYLFLVFRPTTLNKLLSYQKQHTVRLRTEEEFSVNAISANVDQLFDRNSLQVILKLLHQRDFLEIDYNKTNGFMFSLTEQGKKQFCDLNGKFYTDINRYTDKIFQMQSVKVSTLNAHLNQIFKQNGS